MKIAFDKAKNEANLEKHGLDLHTATYFSWDSALVEADRRKDYGEHRFIALGYIDARLHVMIFTPRRGTLRIISLRKANARERRIYEKENNL